MIVPYVDIGAQHATLMPGLLEVVERTLRSGKFILGEQVEAFEKQFAVLCGTRFAVGVNSGTDALALALRAAGIGPGDEVITVPNSFIATTSCILQVGARPVFVDVRDDYMLDPRELEAAITPATRGILPVHLTGRPAPMTEICSIAEKYHLRVIEDCAQAVLAESTGKRVGSFGDAGCFSLHPLKNLNACGDGGIITTNDAALAAKVRLLRNLGLETREKWVAVGQNSRLDELQAAILLVKLEFLEKWTAQRRANARFYFEALQDVEGVQLPLPEAEVSPVYHTFVVQAKNRDGLRSYLLEKGIGTAVHYPVPIHLQPALAGLGYRAGDFPRAEAQARRIVSLPIYPELRPSQLHHVAETIRAFYLKQKNSD